LRPAELARLLQVSREAVRRWFGGAPIAAERWEDIDRLDRILRRLTGYFKPEVLPALVRRKIPGVGYNSPLDLMQTRREEDLFDFYDAVLGRGVTQ